MSEPAKPINAQPAAPEVLLQMATGYWITQALYIAAKLGIADLLKDGPKSSNELAQATTTHAPSLYRVLRSLASVGVFTEIEGGKFDLTPLAEFLRTGSGSMRDMVLMQGEAWHWRPWGELMHSVKTGEMAVKQVFGGDLFGYFSQDAEAAKIFDGAMTNFSAAFTGAVIAAYDFSPIKKLVDVAGGHGKLISMVLKANPGMQGVLFDLPQVIEGARAMMTKEGLSGRCELASGSFFESVPAGGDAYLMKHIIHDWDDERAIAIMKNCHRAMNENGKLLLVEMVLPPGNDPFIGKYLDLEMLVMAPGGRERTEAEYRALFIAAGFKLTRIVPTQSPASVIEGVRV